MGLTDEIKELKEFKSKFEEEELKKLEKKFKFPFGKKVSGGQRKKGYVTLMVLMENGHYEFKKYKIEGQTILYDKIPRLAAAGYVMFDKKGNPLIILPTWSVEPFSPLEHYQKSLINGTNTVGYRVLMDAMNKNQIDNKPKMGGILKWLIGIVVIGIIVYAIFFTGGK